MTSNLGARFLEKRGHMGFRTRSAPPTATRRPKSCQGEVKRTFNPEFLNRLDEVILFEALTDEDLGKITRLLVEEINRGLAERGLRLVVRDDAVDWLLRKTLGDRTYGARPLRRALQRHVEDALSEAFIRGDVKAGVPIEIGVQDDTLWYWQEGRGKALSA